MLNVIYTVGWIFIKILLVFTPLILTVAYLVYFERKVAGHIQVRYGPMRVGKHGWLQPIADVLKLLFKEDITPKMVDKALYYLAPIIVIATSFMALVPLAFGKNLFISNLNVGLLYILSVSSLGVYGIVMGGWASNSKYAFMGGLRSAAQMVSYEVAIGFALIGPVMQAGSLNMVDIVNAQSGYFGGLPGIIGIPRWFVFFIQPLAFLLYFIAALAETNRLPFDLPEAEAELVAGYHTEYSGMKFAFYFLAEYINVIIVSCLAVTCFLGGWLAPPWWLWTLVMAPFIYLSFKGGNFRLFMIILFIFGLIFSLMETVGGISVPLFWFVIKVGFLIFVVMWVRWTYPRFRFDQLMGIGWLRLIPLGLLNIILTGLIALI